MIECPECGFANILGADECEQCHSSLTGLSARIPTQPEEEQILIDTIEALRPREVLLVAPTATVAEVLKMLVDNYQGCVVVVEDDKPVGIFSERDALTRINTEAAAVAEKPISDFMTPTLVTLEATDKIAFALQKMAGGGYRHLPITRDGKLTGIVSVRDFLRYTTETLLQESV